MINYSKHDQMRVKLIAVWLAFLSRVVDAIVSQDKPLWHVML